MISDSNSHCFVVIYFWCVVFKSDANTSSLSVFAIVPSGDLCKFAFILGVVKMVIIIELDILLHFNLLLIIY